VKYLLFAAELCYVASLYETFHVVGSF